MLNYIEYNNIKYPCRELFVHGCKSMRISNESLNANLIDEFGNYYCEEARHIDERIYFFVPNDKMLLSNYELMLYLAKEIV